MNTAINRSVLLGIPIDSVSMGAALEKIWTMVDEYKKDRRNRLVATANVDFIVNANSNGDINNGQSLKKILRKADMVTADGMPLVWLSQIIGRPMPERVTGADMVPAIAEKAARDGKSIYFFGGVEGAAKETAKILSERNPGLKVAGFTAPMIDMNDEFENMVEIARINITEPDILLIALGNPKQEFWFDRYQKYLRVPVSIGIGGTFEFISGKTSRAPIWVQKTGLEWVYRMSQDPKRLIKRYAVGLFRFNLMTMLFLIANSISKIFTKNHDMDAISRPIGLTPGSDREVIVDTLARIRGVGYARKFSQTSGELHLDFSQVKALNSDEVFDLLSIVVLCEKNSVKTVVHKLGGLTRLLLKAYRVYDLVQDTDKQFN